MLTRFELGIYISLNLGDVLHSIKLPSINSYEETK